ncbi:WD40 repeat-containing protein [Richelia sinica FACHB-800]|uniref:WD40 repeat-containing protein n=1 Tax=Richelia sinica FACHB-800 TaxID=1357546 RepID=A0A975TC84_9NOST|nr:WD40 repeat domain-containing protein [Richelia sinica]MBD2666220.1 WD40 repeat domain-containing protein [Richelia sinica FACHB-800]QXE26151.1 WD40 repeat-containing protein [Richelia sinica FACHB-800]
MNTKINQVQHRLAIGNEQERLAALAELLEYGQQGFDCFMEHSLKDKSEKIQQSAYWILHGYNPYLKSCTEEGRNIYPTDTITCLAISPNNKIIVGGTWQKIWVWDLQTGEILYSLFGHSHWVLSVAISPDCNTLVSGSADQTIKIWNLTNGKLTKTLNGHSSWVNAVSISKDGNTLVSGSSDKTIKTWNLQSGQLNKTINEDGNLSSVLCLAISYDNKVIVGGCTNNKIVLCDLETGNIIRYLDEHNSWIQGIIITSDNQQLISASRNGEIKFWQVVSSSKDNSYKLNRRTFFIQGVIDIVSIGLCILIAGKVRTFFDYSSYISNQLLSILVRSIADILASGLFIFVAFLGRGIFGIVDDSSSNQLPIQSLESIRTDKYEMPIYALNDYPLNDHIFIFCHGTTIKVYSRNEKKIIYTLFEESSFIGALKISYDGQIIASAGNNWLRLWNFNTGKPLHPLKGLSYPRLSEIIIIQSSQEIFFRESHLFTVKGLDQNKREIDIDMNQVKWEATGGYIEKGLFTARRQEGNFEIKAIFGIFEVSLPIKIIEPPRITQLILYTTSLTLEFGQSQKIIGQILDQRGNIMPNETILWTEIAGGEIDKDGYFKAGYVPGNFELIAVVGSIRNIVNVQIIEPPKLNQLVMVSSTFNLFVKESFYFVVKGIDQYGNDITISQINWKASQGIIDNQGLYTAGNQEEKVIIQASVGDISTLVEVEIREPSRLTRIEISPPSMILLPGKSCYFSIKGYDQRHEEMSVNNITWRTTDGSIDKYGNFSTFDYQKGICQVSAKVSNLTVTAEVNVPVVLKGLAIYPQEIELQPEEEYQFTLIAFEQTGEPLNPENVIWKSTKGGNINDSGLLEVDYNTEPEITVSATIDNISVNAKVIILPVLKRLEITPDFVYLKPGEEKLFIVKGLDQFGKKIDPGEVYWKTTGGKIDQNGNFIISANNKQVILNSKVIVTSKSVFKYSRKKREFFLFLGIINLMLFKLISYEELISSILNPNIASPDLEAIDVDSTNSDSPTSNTETNDKIANIREIILIFFREISDFLEGWIVKKSKRILAKFFKSWSMFFFNEVSAKLSVYADVIVLQVDGNTYKDFKCLQIIEHHSHWISSLAITLDGQKLISSSWDYTIGIFNLSTYNIINVLRNHTDDFECIAITPDGQEIISAGWDGTITFWNLNKGCLINAYDFSYRVVLVAVTPDGQHLISGEFSQIVKIWGLKNQEVIHTIKPRSVDNDHPFYWHKCITITPDSQRVIVARKKIEVYDIYTGKLQSIIGGDLGGIYALAITPDGGKLISSYDKKIIVWDLTTKSQEMILVLNSYADRNIDLVITPDGQRLVSCGFRNHNTPELDNKSFIEIWDLNNGERIHYMQEYTTEHNLIYCLAITPDGKRIVTGYQNGTIKVWGNPILNS